MVAISYDDTVTLVQTAPGDYGEDIIVNTVSVPAMVFQSTEASHSSNQDHIGTHSTMYLDPTNAFVMANANRLEEILVSIQLFGNPAATSWYEIVESTVNRDTLLTNQIDTVVCTLSKTSEISNVS